METKRLDSLAGGSLVPLQTTGRSTAIARTFNYLVSLIASL